MFKDLFNFKKERNGSEALGFYLAFFGILLISAGVLGALLMLDFNASVIVGQRFAIIACIALSFVVLYKKNQLKNYGLVIVALLSGICAAFSGALLGLIPVAYLTTKKDISEV